MNITKLSISKCTTEIILITTRNRVSYELIHSIINVKIIFPHESVIFKFKKEKKYFFLHLS